MRMAARFQASRLEDGYDTDVRCGHPGFVRRFVVSTRPLRGAQVASAGSGR